MKDIIKKPLLSSSNNKNTLPNNLDITLSQTKQCNETTTPKPKPRKDPFVWLIDHFLGLLGSDFDSIDTDCEMDASMIDPLLLEDSEEEELVEQPKFPLNVYPLFKTLPGDKLSEIVSDCLLIDVLKFLQCIDLRSREIILSALSNQPLIFDFIKEKLEEGGPDPESRTFSDVQFCEEFLHRFSSLEPNIQLETGNGVDPNIASFEELCALPEVGRKIALRIVAARKQRAFSSIEDLRHRVRGIGETRTERLPIIFPTLPARKPQRIDLTLNTAPVSQLEKMPGIGSRLAQKISQERAKKPFRSAKDLTQRIKGMGEARVKQFIEYIENHQET